MSRGIARSTGPRFRGTASPGTGLPDSLVRLRKRSSPGSASASWLLCAIARSVGVAAETAALVLEANANLASVGPDWPPAGPGGRVLLGPRVAALWCEYLVRRRPDGLLDAGLRVLALHPKQSAASRARFRAADGSVVSLIEPQRRDQDVSLPHVTNQLPIGPTDQGPVRPRVRVIDQRPLEPRGRRRTAASSSPPSDGDDENSQRAAASSSASSRAKMASSTAYSASSNAA